MRAFAEGFRSKISRRISKYLDLTDLREVIRGHHTISMDELKENIRYNKESNQKYIFLQVLKELSKEDRFKFIRFVTGRHGLPFGGLSELDTRIFVQFDAHLSGYLPTANTCFSAISLPTISSAAELKHRLLMAINNCETIDRA